MPTSLAPGVYVEEVPPVARPIAGVGTSTLPSSVKPTASRRAISASPRSSPTGRSSPRFIKGAGATDTTPICTTVNRMLALAVFGFFNNGAAPPVASCRSPPAAWRRWRRCSKRSRRSTRSPSWRRRGSRTSRARASSRSLLQDGGPGGGARRASSRRRQTARRRTFSADPMPTGGPTTPDKFSYGAIYFPWLKVNNPLFTTGGAEPKLVDQPPSGHVAGIWARVDANRGVHKAPANEGVVGIVVIWSGRSAATSRRASNPSGINVDPSVRQRADGLRRADDRRRPQRRAPLPQRPSAS